MNARSLILILIVIGLVGAALWALVLRSDLKPVENQEPLSVLSFEDCVAAGYPVMESYPRQCKTPDGRTYAEELPAPEPTYVNASAAMIRITNPTPGAVTGKSFTVTGEARGNWFFEASFPIEVRDAAGNLLTTVVAQAEGDWMTTEFVPFTANVTVDDSFIGEAVLTLKKDNPSGLPENDASVSFPFTVEY